MLCKTAAAPFASVQPYSMDPILRSLPRESGNTWSQGSARVLQPAGPASCLPKDALQRLELRGRQLLAARLHEGWLRCRRPLEYLAHCGQGRGDRLGGGTIGVGHGSG